MPVSWGQLPRPPPLVHRDVLPPNHKAQQHRGSNIATYFILEFFTFKVRSTLGLRTVLQPGWQNPVGCNRRILDVLWQGEIIYLFFLGMPLDRAAILVTPLRHNGNSG